MGKISFPFFQKLNIAIQGDLDHSPSAKSVGPCQCLENAPSEFGEGEEYKTAAITDECCEDIYFFK